MQQILIHYRMARNIYRHLGVLLFFVTFTCIHSLAYGNGGIEVVGDFGFMNGTLVAYYGSDNHIALPDSYKGKSYEVAPYAFRGNKSFKTLTIGENVTKIGDCAFQGCTGLKKLYYNAKSSTCGYFQSYYYDGRPFFGCSSLQEVVIGDKVTSVPKHLFLESCVNLNKVTLGKSLKSIGDKAFFGCSNLFTVINRSSLNIIKGSPTNGYVAFYATSIPKEHGDFVFEYLNESYFDIFYGKYRTREGYFLIDYTGDCKNITLPEDYDGSYYSVQGSTSLSTRGVETVVVPENSLIRNIEDNAFGSSLKAIVMMNTNLKLSDSYIRCMSRGVRNDGFILGIYDEILAYTGDESDITLPDIGRPCVVAAGAFMNNTNISSVIIPENIRRIGDGAFFGCLNLATVVNNSSEFNVVAGSIENGYVGFYADKVVNSNSISTSIGDVVSDATLDIQSYSLGGVKVNSDYRGIVIAGGKKYLRR